ncbi:MAG: YdcH family protein [Alphaproteobacteria bacterium]|nr:YdcH family protein [Alphaproteobacteria bacterium]
MAASQRSHGRSAALKARHSALDDQIQELEKHPSVPSFQLRALKLEKLRIKEQLESE